MKKIYKRGSVAALVVAALLLVGGASVQAQGTSTSSESVIEQLQEQVQQLQERVQELRDQIRSRMNSRQDVSRDDTSTSSPSDVFTDKRMKMGDRGEHVRQLQELLAQDEEIYPEGLATGYYGRLTAQAVARLQQRINVPDTGEMNEETIQRVRELIKDGAGNFGMTPPGLLHAPGIQRFFSDDSATTTDSDDDDDSDVRNHRRGPDIENLSIPEEIKERLRAIFNRFGDDKDDDDGDAEEEIADAEEEIARAEEEISEEKEEGGETEAAEERLEEARDKLEQAKIALNEGREEEAEELAEEAEDFAGDARMKYLGKTSDEINDDELEIEAEAEDGETKVEVEYADGSKEEFTFETTDRDEVITRLAEETDLSEEEIEAVLEFEAEDDDDEEDEDDDDDEEEDDSDE